MGFLKDWFGSDDESASSENTATYTPSTYTTTVSAPNVTTNTVVSKAEAPKEAEMPDTSEYEAGERRRRKKNGVRGTFTHGESATTDTSGVVAESGAIGS